MSLKLPLIFIPGLFGSLGSEVIPHTGKWHFGPSRYTGIRFIKEMEKQGYILNKNFFIMFYNWRQSTKDVAELALAPLIYKVLKLNGCTKVNLLCHGTGGLIGRYYIQSDLFTPSIKHLILVGTPNAGFVAPFNYLSGGNFPYPFAGEPDFISLNLTLFLKIISTSEFPALSEFLPSKSYGDYLIYSRGQDFFSIPYQSMQLQNTFLDDLNTSSNLLQERVSKVILVGGRSCNTVDTLQVFPACSLDKWSDGKVIDCTSTLEGDSCTPLKSVLACPGEEYLFNVDYGELLLQAANLLPALI